MKSITSIQYAIRALLRDTKYELFPDNNVDGVNQRYNGETLRNVFSTTISMKNYDTLLPEALTSTLMQSREVYLHSENYQNNDLQTSVLQAENFPHNEDEYAGLYDNLESVSQVQVGENIGAKSPALAIDATQTVEKSSNNMMNIERAEILPDATVIEPTNISGICLLLLCFIQNYLFMNFLHIHAIFLQVCFCISINSKLDPLKKNYATIV